MFYEHNRRRYCAVIAAIELFLYSVMCEGALEPSTTRQKQANLDIEQTKHQLWAVDHTNFDKQIQ
jgi:hypothetical protein